MEGGEEESIKLNKEFLNEEHRCKRRAKKRVMEEKKIQMVTNSMEFRGRDEGGWLVIQKEEREERVERRSNKDGHWRVRLKP